MRKLILFIVLLSLFILFCALLLKILIIIAFLKNILPNIKIITISNKIKIFNFTGKMIIEELSVVHRTALKSLKKIMLAKKDPTPMEKLLVDLCDADGDFCDKSQIVKLIDYIKK